MSKISEYNIPGSRPCRRVLEALDHMDGIATADHLAAWLGTSYACVCGALRGLCKSGLVEYGGRVRVAAVGGGTQWGPGSFAITASGRKFLAELVPECFAAIDKKGRPAGDARVVMAAARMAVERLMCDGAERDFTTITKQSGVAHDRVRVLLPVLVREQKLTFTRSGNTKLYRNTQ